MPVAKGGKMPNYPKERKRKSLADWSGKQFGRLRVLGLEGYDKHNHRTWSCVCECGNEITVAGNNLQTGNTQSCGCLAEEIRIENGKKLPRRVLPFGIAQKNNVLRRYKTRGRAWSLSAEEAENLITSDCHYCGTSPSNWAITKRTNGGFTYNGIDRIDNARGYETGNVVACCKRCNVAKNDMTYAEFIEWISRVYSHLHRRSEVTTHAS